MVAGLTQKQMNFCQEYVKSGSITDAYLSTYDTTNPVTASREGSRLMQQNNIQEYILELNKPHEVDGIINKQKQIQFIKDRILVCINNNDESSVIKYTDMLNKIYGYYKENVSENKETNKLLDSINIDKARALINGAN